MKKVYVFLSASIGLILAIFVIVLAVQAAPVPNAQEAALNPLGGAFEINVDAQGELWISDYDAAEIWQIHPASGAYTVYENIPSPSDARRDANGYIWWADFDAGRFGRLDPTNGQADWWTAPNASGLYGTQIDDAGKFWALAWDDPYLYRFDPVTDQLCTYTLPLSGTADYPLAHADFIWLGDSTNNRISRLNPKMDQLTHWQLPPDSLPEGLAFADNQDALWWADPNLGILGRLEPDGDRLSNYNVPAGILPEMVANHGNGIWYSEHSNGAIGRLDPTMAVSTTQTVARSTSAASKSCASVTPTDTQTITTSSGSLTWSDQTYPFLFNSGGWQVYDLPTGAFPWGVAAGAEEVWFVDSGRQVLGRIPTDALVTITACKVEDDDGDPGTTGDRTPIQDWTLYLLIDGQRQGNGRKTGADGCTTWVDLGPNVNYGVEEELPLGWYALTPVTHDFGTADPGDSFSHTFINTQVPPYVVYLPMIIRP